ncbi:MAG: hypothetical protein ACE37F_24020 [Nannocystaceae bacterium]|nr:hypothetical protein [bacterium]
MTPLHIDDRAPLSPTAAAKLRRDVAGHGTLQDAVRWAFERGHRLLGVFEQDEFTLDVVFEISPELYLVFDAT